MKLTAITAFSWAHRGVEVQAFEPGESIETDDEDLIRVAVEEGWAAEGDGGEAVPLSAAQLKQALTERGIKFPGNASKAAMQGLLDQAIAAE